MSHKLAALIVGLLLPLPLTLFVGDRMTPKTLAVVAAAVLAALIVDRYVHVSTLLA